MPAKRAATNMPDSQPDPKERKITAETDNSRIADLERQLATARDAFFEQEEAIKHLNDEAGIHERIIRHQQHKISRLTKTPYTAAKDYAEMLADANGRLHTKVIRLEEQNRFYEKELFVARVLLEKVIPGEKVLKEENERLKAALVLAEMKASK